MFFLGVHFKLLGMAPVVGGGKSKDQEMGMEISPSGIGSKQENLQAADWQEYLTCERWIQVDSLKLTIFFLNLQKEIKVLDMLALPLFVIFTEIHIIEKAVDSRF